MRAYGVDGSETNPSAQADFLALESGGERITSPHGALRTRGARYRDRRRSSSSINVTLDAHALRHADPVALLLGLLGEVPPLRHQLAVLATILSELYCNALEHGVLGLDSRRKRNAEGFERYVIEREERLAGLQDGWVCIALSCSYCAQGGTATICVEDSGGGFDCRRLDAAAPDRARLDVAESDCARRDELASSTALHGRGLEVIRALGACLYTGKGGRGVCALYRWNG